MTLERAKVSEESQSAEWHNARVVPLQMGNPDNIRRLMLDQLKDTGDVDPASLCLTHTYVVLKDNESHTPYTFNLAGGLVNSTPDEFKRKLSALKKLASAMHVFGVHASDLTSLISRKPFSWNDDRGMITSHDTIYAAELPVGFKPLAIDPETAHHEFLAVTPGEFQIGLEREEIMTPDGRSFDLIGNLRGSAKTRKRDHHLVADPTDVINTRNAILGAVDQFESQTRQEVALAMLDMEDKRRVMSPEVIAQWKNKLRKYKLTDRNSRDQFDHIYRAFLELYLNFIPDGVNEDFLARIKRGPNFRERDYLLLTDSNVDEFIAGIREQAKKRKLYHLANQFYKACNHVYMNRATKFNRRLPVQGAYLMLQAHRPLGQIDADNITHMTQGVEIDKRPDYFARFMSFAFEAMEAKSINDLYLKLKEYRRLKTIQKSMPKDHPYEEVFQTNLLDYEARRTHIYEVFARFFIPDYELYKDLPEDKRMTMWRRIYAMHSQINDDFYTNLTDKTRPLASHPSVSLALDQLEDVTVDQLDEHLLGAFNLNPYAIPGGSMILPDQDGFEYRRKLLGLIILISEAIPQYEDQIAENTYFIRNVIKHMTRRKSRSEELAQEWSAFLIVDDKTKKPVLIPENAPPTAITGQILTTVRIVPTSIEIDGQSLDFNLFYRLRTKDDTRVFEKALERDDRPSSIFDVTAFTIGIDDSSIQRQFTSAAERNDFMIRLVYLVENKFKQTAEACGYEYNELTDERHGRKDRLEGTESAGGSGASIPLPVLKAYPVLIIKTLLGTQSQTQELQYFPSLSAYAFDWLDYIERYKTRRLITPKMKIEGGNAYMTYPVTHVIYPPQYPGYAGRYFDLMQPHSLPAMGRVRRLVRTAERNWRKFLQS